MILKNYQKVIVKMKIVEQRNLESESDETTLNFEEFINMMTRNISEFRKKYSDNVVFESGKIL